MSEVASWIIVQEGLPNDAPAYLAITYYVNGWTRYYENIPGSRGWCRRSDNDEVGWAVFMVPLVIEFPGDFRPYTVG